MAKSFTYITHQQLKRIFPQVDSYDTKTPIYGWTQGLANFSDTSLDVFYATNTGLITNLYRDGVELRKITYPTAETTTTDDAMSESTANMPVTSESGFGQDDIIKVNSEYMEVNATSSGVLGMGDSTARRGLFGTSTQIHASGSDVFLVVDASADLPSIDAKSDAPVWVYDDLLDMCLIIGDDLETNDPNDSLMETGEDFTAMITQLTTDASRYLDSRLDPNLPREQLKNKNGDFDYIIVRSSALIAASFLVRTTDPTNEVAIALMEEAQENIEALNSGNAALSWQTTRDASRGVVRDVTYTDGSVRPVDTRGYWGGTFDLINVKIGTGGVLGTATYNVYVKDADNLKQTQVVTEEKINGDYQALSGGLQIRFAGSLDVSVAVANDEWEIEVRGAGEHIDASGVKSVANTRWLLG